MTDIAINFKKSGDEIVIGALREIGAAAVNFLGEAAGMALDFAKDAFAGAIDAQAGIDRLNASILRMGDSSPITAQQAQELADQFKNLAGGSDDAILAAENVLLRFDKIGSDVFPDVIQASADLAAAMGMDLNAAATLVGKTLQDMSTDGTASLGRLKAAGVQFTKEQEDQVEALVKAGKVTEAQKILLDALAETTGGAAAAQAETLAGKWAIFQETIADAGEGIALKLLPVLSQLFDQIIAPNIPVVEKIADSIGAFVEELVNAFTVFGDDTIGGISNVLYYLGQFVPVLNDVGDAVINAPELFSQLVSALQPVIDATQNLLSAFQESMPMIQTTVQGMVDFLVAKFNEFSPVIIANVSSALNSIAEFWRANGDTIMAIVSTAFQFITVTIGGALTLASAIIAAGLELINGRVEFWAAVFKGDWETAFNSFVETTSTMHDLIVTAWNTFMESVLGLVGTNLDEFIATWKGVFDQALLIVTTILGQIGTVLLSGLQSAIDGAWAIIGGVSAIGTAIIDGIKAGVVNAAQGMIDAVTGAVDDAIQGAKNLLGIHSPSTVFAGFGKNMMLGMAQGISSNSGAPAYAMAGASTMVMNVGGISISGAGNPQAVAAAVRTELDRMGRSADTRMRTR